MEEGNPSQHPDAPPGWRKLLQAMQRREGEELHPTPRRAAQDQTLIHDRHSWLQTTRYGAKISLRSLYGAGNGPGKLWTV
jgi:hypothetical protein